MAELSRLRWLCRRGMRELDVIMTGYLETRYADASESERESFRALLEMPDPDLFALLLGRQTIPDSHMETLLTELRSQVRPT